MSCMNVRRVLNDAGHRNLSASEQRVLDLHLTACAECREAWHAQDWLNAVPVPETPATLLSDLRAVLREASQEPSCASRPRVRTQRVVTFGCVLLAGAAAAMLGGHYLSRIGDAEDIGETEDGVEAALAREPVDETPLDEIDAAPVAAGAPVEAVTVAEDSADAPAWPESTIALDQATIAVLTLIDPAHERDDPVRTLAEETHEIIARRIRESGTLNLIDPEIARAYQAAGLSDTEIGRATGAGRVVRITTEERNGVAFVNVWTLDPSREETIGFGNFSLNLPMTAEMQKNAVSLVVEHLIENAYPEPEPPLAQQIVEAQTVLLDASRDGAERVGALDRLVRGMASLADLRDAGRPLPESVPASAVAALESARASIVAAGAAIAVASDDPAIRRRAWEALEGADDPYLIQPLLNALSADPSAPVRRAAATTLHDYLDDPSVVTALERARRFDGDDAVRSAAADAALTDEERLRSMRETFFDSSLPVWDRVLAVDVHYDGTDMPLEPDVARELVAVASDTTANGDARDMALTLLIYAADLDDALAEPLLALHENDPEPGIRGGGAHVLHHFTDLPEVRAALEDASVNDPNRSIRQAARASLEGLR